MNPLHWLAGRCLACDLPTQPTTGDLCTQCYGELPWCEQVAEPIPGAVLTLAAVDFQGGVRDWVHQLKYRNGLVQGQVLGQVLTAAVSAQYRPGRRRLGLSDRSLRLPQAIVPVPMPRSSWLRRGRNQASVLAAPVARALNIPVLHRLALRPRKSADQHTLSATERRSLMGTAFVIKAQPPERVAIVDDVLTTGATCAALTRALRAAGAREVHVWCLAATPAPL
ncbi:MAG: ComF family protein [Pseudomonadales bacterium]